MENIELLKGSEFLVKETSFDNIFIPEEFNEEQVMIAKTCEDFLATEVFPNLNRIDNMEPGLMRNLITKSGELGLLGISVPAEYNGFDQSYLTVMRANEAFGSGYSFAVAYMAHTGIGTLPILYYGNEQQKQKYISRLATGEWIAAYCLTEPDAGSDANAGKTKATLSECGKFYILNGQKMWITNGGFADIYTVFAKIDNDRILSAFIVERSFEGITINPEEKKMGIKGSSTCQIFFNDVKVPVENLLGKRGEGFRIAINILHIGRIKLGATVLGGCKKAITQTVNYANERKQFGSFISGFGAIQHKLAEKVIKTWVTESAVYRATMDIEKLIEKFIEQGMEKGNAVIDANADYQVECAMLKVLGSEALDYIVDEMVQIYGGMGFSAEAPADRAYRDSRINRIFEGTNEINRLWASDTAIKRGQKGIYDLNPAIKCLMDSLNSLPDSFDFSTDYFEAGRQITGNLKKATLMVIGAAIEKFGKVLSTEQEVLMNISDMMIEAYAAESALLRVQKLENIKCADTVKIYKDILDVYLYDTAYSISKYGHDALYSVESEKAGLLHKGLHYFTKALPVNIKEARRRIAAKLIEDNRYNF
ncbi:MAG: acyl-CoA dehydrogenase family protein [Bacteroidia bacterium]|nr:acyl-CoA dehydrogenase family protein [Bacteroidia bacterium]